jgi:TonB family protein
MIEWEDDIRRYYAGEMTPKEQHALEKKALSNPFLAEAMEGLESISTAESVEDLNELSAKIKKRTQEQGNLQVAASAAKYVAEEALNWPSAPEPDKKTRSQWIWPLRIAASVAVIVLVYFAITPFFESEKQLALQSNQAGEKLPGKEMSPDRTFKKPDELITNKETTNNEKSTRKSEQGEPIKPIEDIISPSGAAAPVLADTYDQEKQKITEDEAFDMMAENQISEALPESKKEASQVARSKGVVQSFSTNQKVINGKVISAEDGTPLPGVNIVVKGTFVGTVSNMEGNYQLIIDSLDPILVCSFVGMQTQEVKAKGQSELIVKLQSDVSQLSEVVVTGYSPVKDDAYPEPVVKLAEPLGGRRAYDKYLKNSLHYPQQALENQIKGRVTVQFTVLKDGSLDEFSVLKGLGYGCDEEVIRLVKDGPKWSPTTEDDVPVESEVRVRVKFTPPD